MAEGKKKIIFYTNWAETFLKLEDDEAGKLIKQFAGYILDKNPEAPDRLTELLFDPIKDTLKRDLKKYEKIVERNRANGQKGGRKKTQKNPLGNSVTQSNPNKADKDNDTDNDTDKDISLLRNKLESDLKSSISWIQSVVRNMTALDLQTDVDTVTSQIPIFCNKLEAEDDVYKSLKEAKSHFTRWYKLELKSATKNGKQSRSEEILDHNLQTSKELGLDK